MVVSLLATALVAACVDVEERRTYTFDVTESDGRLSVGVEICELGNPTNCTETNSLSRATINVPTNREVAFTLKKSGYGPMLIPDVSDEGFGGSASGSGIGTFRLYSDEELEAIASSLGVQYPWEGGVVALRVAKQPTTFPGVIFRAFGSTVDAVGESFYYDGEEYRRDLDETTEVSSGWLLPLAEGGFTEVSPGDHQFEFAGTGAGCSVPSWGWHVQDQPNVVRLPVRAGYTTYASMACE
jgi:hypothetical protein